MVLCCGDHRHTVFANGSLAITNVDLPDAGKYQCFAINDAGEDYLSLTLKVNSQYTNSLKSCLKIVLYA